MENEVYDATEQEILLEEFREILLTPTGDGGGKREAGLKPPWWRDGAHKAAIFSHLNEYMHGNLVDKDSGAHPLAHMAWRCLAIVYQDTKGKVDPTLKLNQLPLPEPEVQHEAATDHMERTRGVDFDPPSPASPLSPVAQFTRQYGCDCAQQERWEWWQHFDKCPFYTSIGGKNA